MCAFVVLTTIISIDFVRRARVRQGKRQDNINTCKSMRFFIPVKLLYWKIIKTRVYRGSIYEQLV